MKRNAAASAPAPLATDHVALPAFDAGATYRFYREVLGLDLLDAHAGDDWGGRPWLMMIFGTTDGRQLALCALRGAAPPPAGDLPDDVRHFAFAAATPADLARWKGRLAAAGIATTEEDHGAQQSIYFRDPNGHMLEITSQPSGGTGAHGRRAEALVTKWLAAA